MGLIGVFQSDCYHLEDEDFAKLSQGHYLLDRGVDILATPGMMANGNGDNLGPLICTMSLTCLIMIDEGLTHTSGMLCSAIQHCA